MSEGYIQDLKHGLSRTFISIGLLKHLWDHCIELKSFIHSYTAHSNYELDGELPENHMNVQTVDISNICEYSWYEWVMFCYQSITYQYLLVILGRYLGPDIDVRSSMTYKLLK